MFRCKEWFFARAQALRDDQLTVERFGRCWRWQAIGQQAQLLRARQIPHTIPERYDQRARRASRPGRPLTFDRATYARRNVVERCINRLKQWRRLATRYEKRAVNYRAMLVFAALVIWLDS